VGRFVGFDDAPDGALGVQFGHCDDVFWCWCASEIKSKTGVATVTGARKEGIRWSRGSRWSKRAPCL
jgi:hypothetical protein